MFDATQKFGSGAGVQSRLRRQHHKGQYVISGWFLPFSGCFVRSFHMVTLSGMFYATSERGVLADSVVSSGGQSRPCGASAHQSRNLTGRCPAVEP